MCKKQSVEKRKPTEMAKKKGSSKQADAWETVKQIPAYLKPVVHYTFIPLIIVLGMTMTQPRPTLSQLLGPM